MPEFIEHPRIYNAFMCPIKEGWLVYKYYRSTTPLFYFWKLKSKEEELCTNNCIKSISGKTLEKCLEEIFVLLSGQKQKTKRFMD